MSQILLKIKSKYNLKDIFALMDYDKIFKLIKKNKKLQTCLGINIMNYKKRTNYEYELREKTIRRMPYYIDPRGLFYLLIPPTIITIILIIYVLIFASILASKGSFDKNNIKDNYNKNYLKIIDSINLSLFGFLAYIIVSFFLVFFCMICDCERNYGLKLIIKKIILIMIIFLYLCYDVLIIIKLHLSYKIKKSKITWFMICDYILIILIFLYFSLLIFFSYIYFKEAGRMIKVIKKATLLKRFRDIKINDFQLPENFVKTNEYEKRKYILNNKDKYKITISKEQKALITLINKFRRENNIDRLKYDETINFEDLIFDKYAEQIFNESENIFKLSSRNYLLKYPLNEFESRFHNREKNIIDILLNDFLDKIIIIENYNIQFIFIFHSRKNLIDYDETMNENIKIKD